jgi:hypothetical protein
VNRTVKSIKVHRLAAGDNKPGLDEISEMLDGLNMKTPVWEVNWKSFGYKPDVKFSMGYSGEEIFLKYYVRENWFKAEKTQTNQAVYEDSCVEFFVSPSDDGVYYNLEFNAIGTCLMGAGTGRYDNRPAGSEIISKIRRMTSAGSEAMRERSGDFFWTITIALPLEIFIYHNLKPLKGKIFRANFYKCGSKLTVPHYLTWNPVETENPDFHRTEFFGSLEFV